MSSTIPFDKDQLEIERALARLGLGSRNSSPAVRADSTENEENSEIKVPSASEIFDQSGAGIEQAAQTIASIMAGGSNEGLQIKAAEIALKVHGIFKDKDIESKVPQVNISIITKDGESKNLVQVFMPTP